MEILGGGAVIIGMAALAAVLLAATRDRYVARRATEDRIQRRLGAVSVGTVQSRLTARVVPTYAEMEAENRREGLDSAQPVGNPSTPLPMAKPGTVGILRTEYRKDAPSAP